MLKKQAIYASYAQFPQPPLPGEHETAPAAARKKSHRRRPFAAGLPLRGPQSIGHALHNAAAQALDYPARWGSPIPQRIAAPGSIWRDGLDHGKGQASLSERYLAATTRTGSRPAGRLDRCHGSTRRGRSTWCRHSGSSGGPQAPRRSGGRPGDRSRPGPAARG